LKGPVLGVDRLAFKVQGIFRNGSSGAFVLQDVFAEYGRGVQRRRGEPSAIADLEILQGLMPVWV
jgi:hypothetical protein